MLRSVRRAGAVAGLLALAAVTAFGGAATAAPGKLKSPSQAMTTAAEGGSGGSGGLKVVADGLNNPRGIGFGPDGALYVAESGKGGTGPCIPSPEGGEACFGRSGSVTRITRHSQHRVLTGLPSTAAPDGTAAAGPVDLGFSGWTGYLLIGNPGGGTATRKALGPGAGRFGKLLKVDLHGIRSVADFPRFEENNNPDGNLAEGGVDSNPNGLLVGHKSQYVTDAGGNDLLKVDRKGRISVVAVFPPLPPAPAPPDGALVPPQAVPTSVVRGPDGALYVGQLTGFPFPPGGANVYRVVPGHDPEVFKGGFTNIIDIAFDKRGHLYVLEIATDGLLNAPENELPVGRLVRVNKDGSTTTLASEGLNAPGGFVLGHHAAYITNNSILPGAGQVVKVAI
ncbi:MAG TPA: ScyD/ScyE family protein [Actinomycetes bacterium]|nr:ScyD/ScyE family protein [Actinomycetes bacterium]